MPAEPMRVWMVASAYPTVTQPQAGAFVEHQARAVAALGHEVTVVELAPAARTRRWQGLGPTRWVDEGRAPGGIRVIRARIAGGPVLGLRSIGRRAGAAVLEQVARAHGMPDLLHLHFTQMPGLAGTRFARARQGGRPALPTVLTVHEDEGWLRREARVGACRRAWRLADRIVRVSDRDADLLRRWNPRVAVVPNGFPQKERWPSKAAAREALGLATGPQVRWAVSVGSFVPRKRQADLVEAVRLVRDQGHDLRLLLVGSGPTQSQVEHQVRGHRMEDVVRFAGRLSPADLDLAYAAADVGCLASDAEGNPTVMVETLGAGRPYVGTEVGGTRAVIDAVGHGRLVPIGDVQAFAAALADVLADLPPEAAVRRAARPFSWDAIAASLDRIYGEVAGAGRRR